MWTFIFFITTIWAQNSEFFVPDSYFELRPDYISSQCDITDDANGIATAAMQTLAARHRLTLQNNNYEEVLPYPLLSDQVTPLAVAAGQTAEDLYKLQKELDDVCDDVLRACFLSQSAGATARTDFLDFCQAKSSATYLIQKETARAMFALYANNAKLGTLKEFQTAEASLLREQLVISPLRSLVFTPFLQAAERITGQIQNPKTK